jgi:hypothetical protein
MFLSAKFTISDIGYVDVMRVQRENSIINGHPKSHLCARYIEMGRACNAYGEEERRIQGFGGET